MAAEGFALYRTFAHRFHWEPDVVDAQPMALLAAFIHDFEVERIKLDQARENKKDGTGDNVKKQHYIIDDSRVPLSVRVQPVHVADAWIRKWNKENPDKKPIPKPRIGYQMENVPGMPEG